MMAIKQCSIATWLGLGPGTISNIFRGARRPFREEAVRLSVVSGVSFEDWMLADCKELKRKVFIAYAKAHGEEEIQ